MARGKGGSHGDRRGRAGDADRARGASTAGQHHLAATIRALACAGLVDLASTTPSPRSSRTLPATTNQTAAVGLDELLTAAGISHGRIYEFHNAPIYVAIGISVGGPAAWKALGGVVTAFLQRNDRKRVKVSVEGESIEFAGYSTNQVEHMMERMAELHQQQQQRWEEFTGRDHPPAGEVEPPAGEAKPGP
jgi:hypothetical protein